MDEFKISERTIDIENVFGTKNPGLVRWIPGFVFWYLRRIIHEGEINDFLYSNREHRGLISWMPLLKDLVQMLK